MSIFLTLSFLVHALISVGVLSISKPLTESGYGNEEFVYLVREPSKEPTSPREDTVNLGSGPKNKYSDYLTHIKDKIERHWAGNISFDDDKKERTVVIRFTIDTSGRLVASTVVTSSGEATLDETSLKVISRAAPFAPIPVTYHLAKLHIIAHFHYGKAD